MDLDVINKLNNNKDFVRDIFNKYLKKDRSSKPAGIIAYDDTTTINVF